jgi:hypothetical protein
MKYIGYFFTFCCGCPRSWKLLSRMNFDVQHLHVKGLKILCLIKLKCLWGHRELVCGGELVLVSHNCRLQNITTATVGKEFA